MNKLFLAICFSIFAFNAKAATVEIKDVNTVRPQEQVTDSSVFLPDNMPNPDDTEEVIAFFKERFKNASVSHANELGDLNQSDSIDVQHSSEYIAQMQEQRKSTFEKIYDAAMGRISGNRSADDAHAPTTFYELAPEEQTRMISELSQSDIPLVNVVLPTGKKIVAPAREHVPYLLATLNILPSGLIQVQEDITVVANGQKLKHGLTKVLPKYSTSRAGVKKKLDIQLLSVALNGSELPYMLEEIGDYIYIKPRHEYILQPGVYTYTFKYLLDRKLWYYDDFSEFYWDAAGSYLNLVITSANAIVAIPDGKNFLSQSVITGYPKHLSDKRAVVASLDNNALGFASLTPILPHEGMHILVSLDKNVFMEPELGRKFVWFVTDYGDVLFAFAGLAAILISYMLSWKYLKRNKTKARHSFKQTAATMRFMLKGAFDKTAFAAALLEMYRKNIIDIQKQDGTIMLIKKTDNLSALSHGEKEAVNNLFVGKESVIVANAANMLKFKRAYNAIEKSLQTGLKLSSLQLNIGYLLFSVGMLILCEIAIAALGINPLQTGLILLSGTLTLAFYIWILKRKFKSKIVNYAAKTIAVFLIVFAVLLMSIYVKLISSLMIAGMVYTIFEYSELFMKRGGQNQGKNKESEELRKYLENNAATICRGHEFAVQQANIFALDLGRCYPENNINEKIYKLSIASELVQILE